MSDLLARRRAAVSASVATAQTIFLDRARNAEIWDTEGRRYIDFGAGIAVHNTGHSHPKILAAAAAQAERYTHICFHVMGYEPYVALAERLNALAPIAGPAKTLFVTTGAEAIENAIKIARAATSRPAIIGFTGGFHGRTFMAMAVTGKIAPYKRAVGPFPADIYRLPFPSAHTGVTVADTLAALDSLFHVDVEPARVAAIAIETVQGDGGINVAPPELLRELRARCDQHGILLIADEVQCGIARTGRMFAIEHSGVQPDLIAIAKAIGGGFPLAGVIGRAEIMDAPPLGLLGGTYAGPPVALAAGLAVLDVIEAENLLERAQTLGERTLARLRQFESRNDLLPIGNIRGLGSMIGFDLLTARGSHQVRPEAASLTKRGLDHGILLLACGAVGETIRLLYPLTIEDEIHEEGLTRLEATLKIDQGT